MFSMLETPSREKEEYNNKKVENMFKLPVEFKKKAQTVSTATSLIILSSQNVESGPSRRFLLLSEEGEWDTQVLYQATGVLSH